MVFSVDHEHPQLSTVVPSPALTRIFNEERQPKLAETTWADFATGRPQVPEIDRHSPVPEIFDGTYRHPLVASSRPPTPNLPSCCCGWCGWCGWCGLFGYTILDEQISIWPVAQFDLGVCNVPDGIDTDHQKDRIWRLWRCHRCVCLDRSRVGNMISILVRIVKIRIYIRRAAEST